MKLADTVKPLPNDDEQLRAAVAAGNVPTLLMVLVQLTGDMRWLADPYRPTRSKGMSDNDTGGLPQEVQDVIRREVLRALVDWRDGQSRPADPLSTESLVEMMSACVGEPVAHEYAPMMMEEMGLLSRSPRVTAQSSGEHQVNVLIIGAGLSGICAGIKLDEAGIPYEILEKNDAVGGTWYENTYPGAGVDTPSHLYSYSFEPNHAWSRYYSKQKELHAYLEACASGHGVRSKIRFRTEVLSARYDVDRVCWVLEVRDERGTAKTLTADAVITAVGQLNRPKIPNIPGMDTFAGPVFHTAQWRHDVDLTNKRVAVVGTGASSMQVVPVIAPDVERLFIFQRSPQWSAPNENYFREVSPGVRLLLESVPFYAAWYRFRLLWMFNDRVHASLQVDPSWPHLDRSVNETNDAHRAFFTDYLKSELGDRDDLIAKSLPNYPPFGKRMLIDNGWFRALTRDNVDLITDPIVGMTPSGIVTRAGEEFEVDAVVLGTGFDSLRLLGPLEVTGKTGATLRDTWGDDDARAYLGISVPGFPNFFCLYGPNTNLGHGGSIVFHAECQVRYVVSLLSLMLEHRVAAVDCKTPVFEEYCRAVDVAHSRMIWTHPGMETWYRNRHGRVVTNSPWRLVDYWRMTHEPDLREYDLTLHDERAAEADAG